MPARYFDTSFAVSAAIWGQPDSRVSASARVLHGALAVHCVLPAVRRPPTDATEQAGWPHRWNHATSTAGCGYCYESATGHQARRPTRVPPAHPAGRAPRRLRRVAGPATVSVSTTNLGMVLTDSGGLTLGMFTIDKSGTRACYDQSAAGLAAVAHHRRAQGRRRGRRLAAGDDEADRRHPAGDV